MLARIMISDIGQYLINGGQTMSIVDLLMLLNFPPDAQQRLLGARGDVDLKACPGSSSGSFTNSGKKISENIPAASGFAGILLQPEVSGSVHLEGNKLVLDDLKGVEVDLLGPWNPSVKRLILTPGNLRIEW